MAIGPAFAQEGGTGKPTSTKRKKDEPQFDRDAEAKKAAEETRDAATPEQALERALPTISTWPGDGAENALRALITRGPEMVPLLRARLKSGTVLERSAAARGLCLLGDKEALPDVEKLFADPRQRARYSALLVSVRELDAAKANELALRFLDSEQAPLRSAATGLFKNYATPEIVATLKQRLAETQSDAIRVDLFSLLELLKDKELPTIALHRFLGDEQPQLAGRAATLLSELDDPEIRAELLRLAKSNRERRGLHACLVLALAEQRVNSALLPDELFEQYLPTVRTSDLLLRTTSCVVCGLIGYRSETREEATRTRVLPALEDAVVNGRFFGDFELCFKASVATLELLTGQRLGESVPAWRDYFAKHAGGDLAGHRDLKAFVLDEDARVVVVTLANSDAAGHFEPELTLCGPVHRAAVSLGERPGEIVLSETEMRALLEGLEQDAFLTSELPRSLPTPEAGSIEIRVESRGRGRTVVGSPGSAPMDRFAACVRASAAPLLWQTLLPRDETYTRLFAEEEAWQVTHPDAAARRGRMIDLALAEIARADGPSARHAFDVLARFDQLGATVRAAQIDGIAALLKKMPASDARGRKLFELLVSTRRADALNAIVDALSPRGAAGVAWAAEAVTAIGNAAEWLKDSRPLARLAALAAVEKSGAAPPSDQELIALATGDEDEHVRAAAVGLLARSTSELAATTLIAIANDATSPVRVPALRQLGLVHGDDALACLVAAARGNESALAGAALEGLVRRGDQAAAAALDGIVRERGPADSFGRLALVAIKGLPRPLAVDRLRRLMNEGGGVIAKEAAYGLADLGEFEAVPALLVDLEDARLVRRAQTLLTYLFCKDLGTETWRFRSLYESQPGASHSQWFLAALREGGAPIPEGKDLKDAAFVPVLVAAIEDPRWFVRRSALECLEAATGRTLGALGKDATNDEIADLARRWREATATTARGAEQH